MIRGLNILRICQRHKSCENSETTITSMIESTSISYFLCLNSILCDHFNCPLNQSAVMCDKMTARSLQSEWTTYMFTSHCYFRFLRYEVGRQHHCFCDFLYLYSPQEVFEISLALDKAILLILRFLESCEETSLFDTGYRNSHRPSTSAVQTQLVQTAFH